MKPHKTLFFLLLALALTACTQPTAAPTPTVAPPSRTPIPPTVTSVPPTLTPTPPLPTITATPIPPTATLTPYRTPLPGEIITSPDERCQLVPEPELVAQNDLAEGVHLAGVVYLCRGWPDIESHRTSFDLDTGYVGVEEDIGVDLYFNIRSPTIDSSFYYYMMIVDNAAIFETTAITPDRNECLTATTTKNSGLLVIDEDLSTCWITSEGRLAFVHIDSLDPYGQESIAISFVTWEK